MELENTEFTPEEKEYVIRQLREITRNGPSELRALRQSDGFVPGLDSSPIVDENPVSKLKSNPIGFHNLMPQCTHQTWVERR
jgi:hypothetical protein